MWCKAVSCAIPFFRNLEIGKTVNGEDFLSVAQKNFFRRMKLPRFFGLCNSGVGKNSKKHGEKRDEMYLTNEKENAIILPVNIYP